MVAVANAVKAHTTTKTTTLPRKRSITSDPIFGQSWCDAQLDGKPVRGLASQGVQHYIRWPDFNPARPANTRKPLPTSINRNVIDDGSPERLSDGRARRLGTYGGGLVYSPAFGEYLAPVVPHLIAEERATCWQWYTIPYVAAGVLRHFGTPEQRAFIDAVVKYRRDGEAFSDVAADVPCSTGRLATFERRILRFVRSTYGMGGSIGPDVQVWHAEAVESGPMVTGELAG